MIEMVVEQQAPAMQRLQAAVAAEAAAQAAKAVAILDLAHEQEWYAGAEFEMVRRRPVRIGVDDAPLVDETLPLEVAALTGTSVAAATALIRDIVNLHHRHEHAWRAVTDGRIPLWRARQLTQLAEAFELGMGECMMADARIQPMLGLVGWGRVMARYRAAIIEVAPAKVAAHNAKGRRNRHIAFGTDSDDPTLSWMSALADTGDVRAFEHLLGLVTKALIELGDTDPIDIVRSKALGRMADPEGVLALLDGADDNSFEARQAEKRSRRRHAPVAMREAVFARDRYEVFPYSSREARGTDLDHTIPYVEGVPGQTRPSNLGPLTRRPHRGKTHGGWQVDQPRPGVFWWQSPHGQIYRVGADGTRNLTPDGTDQSAIERLRLWELDRRIGGHAA